MATDFSEAIAAWITETAETREAAWKARREARVVERVERKAARDAGLRKRHARKLAHIQWQASIT